MTPASNTPSVLRTTDVAAFGSLDEIAAFVEDEHRLVGESATASLVHAIRAGLGLIQAKALVDEGRWTAWLTERDISVRTASDYTRVAHYRDDLIEADGKLNLVRALTYLRGRPPVDIYRGGGQTNDPRRVEVHRLRREGHTQQQIADRLGIGRGRVWYYLLPADRRKRMAREQDAKRRERNRSIRLAQKQAELVSAASGRGDALERAYANLRITLQELQAALPDADGEARSAVRQAIDAAYRVEDFLGVALRAPEKAA